MEANKNTLVKFYTAFAFQDTAKMHECYHPKVQFRDPVFGLVKERSVFHMWEMLIERGKGNIKIEFSDIQTNEYTGSAQLIATYHFSKTNRKVVNTIQAEFHFKDGLIIKHTDDFDLWEWSKQALGVKGVLLGWTGYFQKKIQQDAVTSLKEYQNKIHAN